MNNFTILIKMYLQASIGSIKRSKSLSRFTTSGIILWLLVAGLLLFSMGSSAYAAMQGYTTLGIPEVMLFPGVMLAMLLAVLMAVLRGASTGTSIDAELLLSLPIKRSTILLSKSVAKYLFELIFSILFLLPYVVVYFGWVDMSAGVLLRGLLMVLLLPLLSVGVAYILGFFFFHLGSRVSNPQMFTTVICILMVVAFLLYNFTSGGGTAETAGPSGKHVAFVSRPALGVVSFIAFGDLLFLGLSSRHDGIALCLGA